MTTTSFAGYVAAEFVHLDDVDSSFQQIVITHLEYFNYQ